MDKQWLSILAGAALTFGATAVIVRLTSNAPTSSVAAPHVLVAPPPKTSEPVALPAPTETAPAPSASAAPTGSMIVIPMPSFPAPGLPTGSSVFKHAAALAVRGDNAGARVLLEPRVVAGEAYPEEVRLLTGICRAQHDDSCVAAIKSRYPK